MNAQLDELPRMRVNRLGTPWPVFRTLGIAGYYVAVAVTLLTGLWAGRSLVVLSAMSAACALSFFVYALARKRVTGREQLVLLEHVWFAMASASATLWALREPQLLYLDHAAAGLCFFLAFGRAGCTVTGCCHGPPSSLGIVYPAHHVDGDVAHRLWGVRLFPVQTLEGIGLVLLGLVCTALSVAAEPGAALFTFGAGYAVMRFGLEAIRFDPRPQLFGLSQSRWMALAELTAVAALIELRHPPLLLTRLIAAGALAVLLIVALALKARGSARRVSAGETKQVRELVADLAAEVAVTPGVRHTRLGTSIALSKAAEGFHLSLSADHSLWLGCSLLSRAFPSVVPANVELSAAGVVHALLPVIPETGDSEGNEAHAVALYAAGLRKLTRPVEREPADQVPESLGAPRVEYFRKLR
ncbi:MAG: prolipoprotein diacylglyceryl transferase [Myxococcaceae bacterium]